MSEMVITAILDVPLKGLVPYDYAGVFEPHYTDHSSADFVWTVAKAEQGSYYVRVVNPSSEEVMLQCGIQIGTFHPTSGNNNKEYIVMENSVCNINIQQPVIPKPPILPDFSNPYLTSAQHKKLKNTLNRCVQSALT